MESTPTSYFLKLFLFLSILRHFPPKSSSTPTSSLPLEALPTKSGYLPVNPTTGSAIFYAFYEAQKPTSSLSETPLIIWLQGGPGCSSLLGNFYELGPWRVFSSQRQDVEHISLEPNPGSWNRLFGLLFLDNPIGTGFSIASNADEIPRNQYGVAKHLFAAIKSFVALEESFKSRPIYITGESYAGKYVPAIGYFTLKWNAKLPESSQVSLAGVAIGNGLTDPVSQVGTHAVNAYYSGLINDKQMAHLEQLQAAAVEQIKVSNWTGATDARNKVLHSLQSMTGVATLYDYRRKIPYQDDLVTKFLSNVEIKKAIGANESIVYEVCSDAVGAILNEDVMKSVKYMVEFLVKNSKVLLYQGFFDLRDGVVSSEAWIKKIRWDGIGKFLAADRKVWRVNDELAGYVQKWGSLSHVVVLGAGHLVPADQAVNSQEMIEDWILEKGLFANEKIGNLPLPTNFSGAL